MKVHYVLMDNAPIHTPVKVRETVESRGYKCLYLPPYSPFLNRIEEFWSKVKAGIRRNTLSATDILSDRICDSVQKVSRSPFASPVPKIECFCFACDIKWIVNMYSNNMTNIQQGS